MDTCVYSPECKAGTLSIVWEVGKDGGTVSG